MSYQKDRLIWIIILSSCLLISLIGIFGMILNYKDTKKLEQAAERAALAEFMEEPPMIFPTWTLPAEPVPEEGMALKPKDNKRELEWAAIDKPDIILDLSSEDWEIIVGQSAEEFIVFHEDGKVICTIGVIDGALLLDGKESKAIEFIRKYFELWKVK